MYSSAKKFPKVLTASEVRKTFIDFFTHTHDHKLVRSSPVVPFCDSTLAFTNAGMNQFKSIFLGTTTPPSPRVANSQKCVRVGGKHNDLDVVGKDGYHHTFFEMLGNWSFDDYFKQKACSMALELLRDSYGIDQRRLYVTYFSGDSKMKIPADIECYEIWRSLGFPAERILPFGSEHNFWEMGAIGPCGPCTEIHIDHNVQPRDTSLGAELVNGGFAEITELWNLVFIEYNRNADGTIDPLPAKHVDTGMGFERLTAVLQNKSSNYDTDLFTPIFKVIRQTTQMPEYGGKFPSDQDPANLDTAYRVMADHMRMVSVCLADGMLPDFNQKLRRVLRKVFNLSENVFGNKDLPTNLVPVIVESLGNAYPELNLRENSIKSLIVHEQEIYNDLRESSTQAFKKAKKEFPQLEKIDIVEDAGFLPAFREFQLKKPLFIPNKNIINSDFLFKMYDTYGLIEKHFHQIALLEEMELDLEGFKEKMTAFKKFKTRNVTESNLNNEAMLIQLTKDLVATEDRYRYFINYNYRRQDFDIPVLSSTIIGVFHKDKCMGKNEELQLPVTVGNIKKTCVEKDPIYIVTDASNFYVESGGQQSDQGELHFTPEDERLGENWHVKFKILDVRSINENVVHVCQLPGELVYDDFTLEEDNENVPQDTRIYQQYKAKKLEVFMAKKAEEEARVENEVKDVKLKLGMFGRLHVDRHFRHMNSCHHTTTHLLNAALRKLFENVVYQVSSSVTSENSKLEVGFIGKRLDKNDVTKIENWLNLIIEYEAMVRIYKTSAFNVIQDKDITLIPGEIYPESGLRIINIQSPFLDFISKEPCCGTHVYNTRELKHICITNFKQTNRGRYAFTLVANSKAEEVLKNETVIRERLRALEEMKKTDQTDLKKLGTDLQSLRNELLHGELILPYVFKMNTLDAIEELLRKLKDSTRTSLNEFVDVEMQRVLQTGDRDQRFVLHFLDTSSLMEEVPLQKATRLCKDRPILVVANSDGLLSARCCVPKNFQSDDFNAEKWLRIFSNNFSCALSAPKGQTMGNVCIMKGRKLPSNLEHQIEDALRKAREFAKEKLLSK